MEIREALEGVIEDKDLLDAICKFVDDWKKKKSEDEGEDEKLAKLTGLPGFVER